MRDRHVLLVLLRELWPCAFYFSCSLTMNLLTKALVTSFGWHAVSTLGAIQSIFTLASLGLLAGFRYALAFVASLRDGAPPRQQREQEAIRETGNAADEQPSKADQHEGDGGAEQGSGEDESACSTDTDTDTDTDNVSLRRVKSQRRGSRLVYVARVLVPLVILHVSNMLLGFTSLRVVNLPMYLVLRRLTTITVMLIEWLVLRKPISHPIKLALLVGAAGSVIAGSTDVMSDARGGFSLVLLQNLCTAMSLAFSKESGLTPRQLVLLNSSAAAVCCTTIGFALERDEVLAFPHLRDPRFLAGMIFMCGVCVLYQFSVQLCTLRTSALTTSVTGNVKDLFATAGGFLLFPDAPMHPANLVGVALSFIGAYSFSYIRYCSLAASPSLRRKQQ